MIHCRACHTHKPPTDFEIRSDTGKRRTTCLACRAEAARGRLSDPVKREVMRRTSAAWKLKHPDEVRATAARYHAENKEKRNATSRAWQERKRNELQAR